jgi:hypothetical protein
MRPTRAMRGLQPDHDPVVPDIEAVICQCRPDMLQPLTSGTFMARTIYRRGNVLAAPASLNHQKSL